MQGSTPAIKMLCLKWDAETRGAAGGRATKWIRGLGKCPASKSLSCVQFIDRNSAPVPQTRAWVKEEAAHAPLHGEGRASGLAQGQVLTRSLGAAGRKGCCSESIHSLHSAM